jgi:adenylate kinase
MRLVFFGPPGSGKGTYASRIGPKFGIPHISTGDIFRQEVAGKTELGKKVEKYLKAGELVPDEIVIEVVKKRLNQADCKNGWILDGFPRTIAQAEALESFAKPELVINFVLDEEIIVKKLSARRVCERCGEIYNIADIRKGNLRLPPMLPKVSGICDKCGGRLIQRPDDQESVIRDRLVVYKQQSAPVLEWYRKKGLLKNVEVVGPPEVMVPIVAKMIEESLQKI